jgi:hypothetical protein
VTLFTPARNICSAAFLNSIFVFIVKHYRINREASHTKANAVSPITIVDVE